MRRTAFRRLQTNIPISWLLRDEFSDTLAAGSVNGAMATPGPGARTAADTSSKLSISADTLVFASGGVNFNPYLLGDAKPRSTGRAILFKLAEQAAARIQLGLTKSSALSSDRVSTFDLNPGSIGVIPDVTTGTKIVSAITPSAQRWTVLLRAVGAQYLIDNILVFIDAVDSTASLRSFCCNIGTTTSAKVDWIRDVAGNWLAPPLVSDGFGSTFGTTDGLGHAEGVSGGIGVGGGNMTLTQQIGTWANSAGKAAAATLSGGVAVATVPLSTADVFAKVKVTRSAGSGGMVLRWTDANNHLYTEHDGTNAYLKQVLAGSTTTLVTAAATYSAGAEIVVDLSGVNGRLYWNNALVGSTSSISSSLTSTLHGLRSTDTGGIQLDDLCIYAKGTGGEYNVLNRYVNL